MDLRETQLNFDSGSEGASQKERAPQKQAASEAVEVKDHRHGHRARLRARFLESGGAGMPDYELLELILMLAIPRRDVKPLAKSLIERFGGYAAVLSADAAQLRAADGLGEAAVAAIKAVQASAQYLIRTETQDKPILSNWQSVADYLQSTMARLPREQFRILFLDRKNALITDEVLSDGTVDQTAVYPREILKRALTYDASAIILVHNHPSGDPSPSQADIAMTKEVMAACQKVGVAVHDHIIVGRYGQTSFKQHGLI